MSEIVTPDQLNVRLSNFHSRDVKADWLAKEYESLDDQMKNSLLNLLGRYEQFLNFGFVTKDQFSEIQNNTTESLTAAFGSGKLVEKLDSSTEGSIDFLRSGNVVFTVFNNFPKGNEGFSAIREQGEIIRNIHNDELESNPANRVLQISVFKGGFYNDEAKIEANRNMLDSLIASNAIAMSTTLFHQEMLESENVRIAREFINLFGTDESKAELENFVIPDNFFNDPQKLVQAYAFIFPKIFGYENSSQRWIWKQIFNKLDELG